MPIYMHVLAAKGGKRLVTGAATGKYAGWVELESCQMGVHRTVRNPERGRELEAPVSEILVTRRGDAATSELLKLSLGGPAAWAQIDFVKDEDKGSPYMSMELENMLISSFNVSGRGTGDEKPMESLSLSVTKITFITVAAPLPDKQAVRDKATWDLAAGTVQ